MTFKAIDYEELDKQFRQIFFKNHNTRKSWGSQLSCLINELDYELHTTIIKSVFKKLKIDSILTVDHTVSSMGKVNIRFLLEKRCYGINLINGTIKPIYSILNSNNPTDYLPNNVLNFVVANSLENQKLIDILKIKPVDVIKEILMYEDNYEKEEELYGWSILGINNNTIYREYLPLLHTEAKNDIITMIQPNHPVDEDGEFSLPPLPDQKYILENISGTLGNTDRICTNHQVWNHEENSKFKWKYQNKSVMHNDDRWKILCQPLCTN